jgi:CheY-like chemotaxis protein
MNVLIIEDSKGYQRLLLEAFKSVLPDITIHFMEDGAEGSNFLKRQGRLWNSPRPDLIVLDLNLPKKNGRELLIEVKGDDELARIPIAIFTSSKSPEDIEVCKQYEGTCFLTKPMGFNELVDAVKFIDEFYKKTLEIYRKG